MKRKNLSMHIHLKISLSRLVFPTKKKKLIPWKMYLFIYFQVLSTRRESSSLNILLNVNLPFNIRKYIHVFKIAPGETCYFILYFPEFNWLFYFCLVRFKIIAAVGRKKNYRGFFFTIILSIIILYTYISRAVT
jgi:hypothetical protein